MHRSTLSCAPTLISLLALAGLVGGNAAAEDAPSFHIAAIGSFPGRGWGVAINNDGEVAISGLSSTTPPAQTLADTWLSGTLTALGDLGGGTAAPEAMNDAGTLVGVSSLAGGAYHPALWSGTSVTDLSSSLGADASPMAINNHGVVASWVEVATPTAGLMVPNAATYAGGVETMLPTLTPGDAYTSSHCYGINDSGTVVGDSGADAVEWSGGTPTSLGEFGISDFSGATAYAINASGVIACWASDTTGRESLWLWDGGTTTALPPLPSGYSQNIGLGRSLPLSINAGGDVVGQHYLASAGTVAVLWHDGQAYNLQGCIATGEGAGWTSLTVANSINDQGEIVGAGTYNGQVCAFLLTPVAAATATATTTGTTTGASASTGSTTGTGTGTGTSSAAAGSASAPAASGSGSAGGCGLGGSTGLLALALALQLQRLRGSRARR